MLCMFTLISCLEFYRVQRNDGECIVPNFNFIPRGIPVFLSGLILCRKLQERAAPAAGVATSTWHVYQMQRILLSGHCPMIVLALWPWASALHQSIGAGMVKLRGMRNVTGMTKSLCFLCLYLCYKPSKNISKNWIIKILPMFVSPRHVSVVCLLCYTCPILYPPLTACPGYIYNMP